MAPAKFTCRTRIGDVLGRQRELEHAEDGDVAGRNLDDDAERQADQGRLAPAELGHRPDQERALLRREERLQVADDARRVLDHVLREHHALRWRWCARHRARLESDRAVEAEQAAHGQQREAEAELDAGPKSAVMMTRSEKPSEPSGSLVSISPMAAVEEVGDDELKRAGIAAVLAVEEQEAAASDHAGIERQSHPLGRQEGDVQLS